MGRIVGVRDEASPPHTSIEVEHVLSYVKRAVLGNDMWSATIKDGVYLSSTHGTASTFQFSDHTPAVDLVANPLTIVSGAPGVNEIKEGRYQIGEIVSFINSWLSTERTAGRLSGIYEFALAYVVNAGIRSRMTYNITGVGTCSFLFSLPQEVWRFLGRFETIVGQGSANSANGSTTMHAVATGGAGHLWDSTAAPLRFMGYGGLTLDLTDERGTFVAQDNSLPSVLSSFLTGYTNKGLVIIDGKQTALVAKSGAQFTNIQLWQGDGVAIFEPTFEIAIDDPRGPIKVQQYFHFVGPCKTLVKQIFYSTATPGLKPTASSLAADRFASMAREVGDDFLRTVMSPDDQLRLQIYKDVRGCQRGHRSPLPPLVVDDAGRGDRDAADCAVRACAIALCIPYGKMLAEFEAEHHSPPDAPGYPPELTGTILERRGGVNRGDAKWSADRHPHLVDLPKVGRIVAVSLNHVHVLIDGEAHDMELRQGSITCVLQWWEAPLTRQQRRAAKRASR